MKCLFKFPAHKLIFFTKLTIFLDLDKIKKVTKCVFEFPFHKLIFVYKKQTTIFLDLDKKK
jgi:hypothetical protein